MSSSIPRVVIVGAGIVGCSLADELTARGWTDVTVLDKGPLPLTGGSTSHAPGLVFATNSSRSMSRFAAYTASKFKSLDCFLDVGGLEVATTPERVDELHRRHGFATSWGLQSEVVDAERCLELYPLLDRGRILAGLHTPDDGLAKAVKASATQAEQATARGARFIGGMDVTSIDQSSGRVTAVRAGEHTFEADIVVCCAGFWGPELGDLLGMRVPLQPLAHQYAHTTELDLPSRRARTEAILPILRHQDERLYYREHGDHLGIGSYHHRPMPVDSRDLGSSENVTAQNMPSSMPFTEADFADAWQRSTELLPSLGEAKIQHAFNGIFSFTPDGAPIVGESREVQGLWVSEAIWVTHSAGVAKSLAEQMITGHSEIDMHECDLYRFEKTDLVPSNVARTSAQNFVEVYDIIHPLQPKVEPRPLRVSPFYGRQQELGAMFLDGAGWERPHWYEANNVLLEQLPEQWQAPKREPWSAKFWSPISAVEAWRTREAVAMYDMTLLRRLEVGGPGALALLQRLTTNQLDKKVGSVTYALMLDETGGVRSDVTVARVAEERFQVGVNGPLDEDWMQRHAGSDVYVRDITGATACIGLWGPLAREVLAPLTSADISHTGLKYFNGRTIHVGGVDVLALRLSYVGELGWELYTDADTALRLWDTLWEAGQAHGVVAAGRSAFNSLRLEKGYRSWGTDMTTEHDPYQAGLGFAVRKAKGDFIGASALQEERGGPVLTCLTLDDPSHVVMGKEPVLIDGTVAGYVTSAAYGYTIGKTVAYAWLPAGLKPGEHVAVQYFRDLLPATVMAEPLVDPDMNKIRC
ncbi:FAD-dependent oxidoreductase [Rhodococcus sp. 14-2483-1-2]|uniref:GcvT family protein n=1 Tax=Rhodococcus sp. 14-2483-1-2 TaxID=2023147 RepID=UPI000B9B9820|nr:FAD-dependent oxidoreductase [Rhodococcus sp. 14-2483-1-2]OZF35100.1 sarcosine dehydrogenase [Rhodococcus sp. 14-2483-1-2]